MELISYLAEQHQEIIAQMLTAFDIWHREMLKKPYDYDEIFKESYEMIPKLNEGQHRLYIGQENGEAIGFIVLDYRGSEVCWIDDLFVLASKRNHGYGSQMIQMASELVRNQGYEAISIDVVPRNINAIRLYLKLGFDSLSLLTLRHDFDESYRDRELELFDFKLKY